MSADMADHEPPLSLIYMPIDPGARARRTMSEADMGSEHDAITAVDNFVTAAVLGLRCLGDACSEVEPSVSTLLLEASHLPRPVRGSNLIQSAKRLKYRLRPSVRTRGRRFARRREEMQVLGLRFRQTRPPRQRS